jgi:hypothetical protein
MSIEELKREYKRMMELKKIRDQRDMVATGGRVGFDDGGILSLEEAKKLNPGMFVDTTTYNPIPENAPNMAADEIAKVIMGTGFLPEEDDELGYPEGMEKPMSSREFIFKSYVVPKRKELMENFGLTMKEADDLIREGMAKYRTNKAIGGRVGFQKGTSKIFDQLEMDVPHPYGHRVNYQIGGPAYDATRSKIFMELVQSPLHQIQSWDHKAIRYKRKWVNHLWHHNFFLDLNQWTEVMQQELKTLQDHMLIWRLKLVMEMSLVKYKELVLM